MASQLDTALADAAEQLASGPTLTNTTQVRSLLSYALRHPMFDGPRAINESVRAIESLADFNASAINDLAVLDGLSNALLAPMDVAATFNDSVAAINASVATAVNASPAASATT